MHRMRTLAVGLAVATCLGSGAMALAPTALASVARPAGTGSFHSWRAAQRAAGFGLLRPSYTAGLRQTGAISVDRCQAAGKLSKRSVFAGYGSFLARWLSIQQDNAGGGCGNFGEARVLGHYRVQGRRATMFGVCGKHLGPPCSSRKITLYLTWNKHGNYYVAGSHNERRHALVAFARGLYPV
jgi:hypothetical protein